jgi:hypothetical protein
MHDTLQKNYIVTQSEPPYLIITLMTHIYYAHPHSYVHPQLCFHENKVGERVLILHATQDHHHAWLDELEPLKK